MLTLPGCCLVLQSDSVFYIMFTKFDKNQSDLAINHVATLKFATYRQRVLMTLQFLHDLTSFFVLTYLDLLRH